MFRVVFKDSLKEVTIRKAPKRGPASIKEVRVPAPPAFVVAAAAAAAYADPADEEAVAVARTTVAAGLAAAAVMRTAVTEITAAMARKAPDAEVGALVNAARVAADIDAKAAVLPLRDASPDDRIVAAVDAACAAAVSAVVDATDGFGVRRPLDRVAWVPERADAGAPQDPRAAHVRRVRLISVRFDTSVPTHMQVRVKKPSPHRTRVVATDEDEDVDVEESADDAPALLPPPPSPPLPLPPALASDDDDNSDNNSDDNSDDNSGDNSDDTDGDDGLDGAAKDRLHGARGRLQAGTQRYQPGVHGR